MVKILMTKYAGT